MTQQIVTWCDSCLAVHEEQNEGTPRSIAMMGKPVKVVDLCDQCAKVVLGPVIDLVNEYGRSPNSPPGLKRGPKPHKVSDQSALTPEQYVCPVNACTDTTVFSRRSSVRAHMKTVHDEDLAVYEAQVGRTLDGHEITHPCPECDAGFASPQGRGAHRSHAHGYSPSNAA